MKIFCPLVDLTEQYPYIFDFIRSTFDLFDTFYSSFFSSSARHFTFPCTYLYIVCIQSTTLSCVIRRQTLRRVFTRQFSPIETVFCGKTCRVFEKHVFEIFCLLIQFLETLRKSGKKVQTGEFITVWVLILLLIKI